MIKIISIIFAIVYSVIVLFLFIIDAIRAAKSFETKDEYKDISEDYHRGKSDEIDDELEIDVELEDEDVNLHAARVQQLENQIDILLARIDALNIKAQGLEEKSRTLEDNVAAYHQENENLLKTNNELLTTNHNLELKINENQEKIKGLNEDVIQTSGYLEELKQRNQIVTMKTAAENGIDGKEKYCPGDDFVAADWKLIELIREIGDIHPEIKIDLGKVIWTRLWIKEAQKLCKLVGVFDKKVKGIYRLVLKGQPSICYVGQAVDIKDRWYTHMKKMCNAEAVGGEKLYKWLPSDFKWEVLEVCEDLDKAEKYWIEFYCADVVGLNSKGGNK